MAERSVKNVMFHFICFLLKTKNDSRRLVWPTFLLKTNNITNIPLIKLFYFATIRVSFSKRKYFCCLLRTEKQFIFVLEPLFYIKEL